MKQVSPAFKISTIATAIYLAYTPSLYAQENESETAKNKDLEVISVTATRRSQSISSVPYNISAIGGDTLNKPVLQV